MPQWVFPLLELGEADPAGPADGGFGPIYLNDQITLLFEPSSFTGNLTYYCDWQDTQQGAIWTIPNPTGSPLTYTFNETTPNANDTSDVHICHFYNIDGTIGNTETFQYFNFPNKDRTRWTQAGTSPIIDESASTTTASASATASSTGSPASVPSAASSDNPQLTDDPSSDISTGAIVGIAIGSVVAVLAIVGLILFLLRRRIWKSRYAKRSQYGTAMGGGAENAQQQPQPPMHEAKGWYAPGNVGTRMAEVDGATVSEKDGRPAPIEKDASPPEQAERSELPG